MKTKSQQQRRPTASSTSPVGGSQQALAKHSKVSRQYCKQRQRHQRQTPIGNGDDDDDVDVEVDGAHSRQNFAQSLPSLESSSGNYGVGKMPRLVAKCCAQCSKPIKRDKFLLKACGLFWHENCLRCSKCKRRLGEIGSSLYLAPIVSLPTLPTAIATSSINTHSSLIKSKFKQRQIDCHFDANLGKCKILCKSDYLDLFGGSGLCSLCCKTIKPSELIMRAKQNVYHLECFACQICEQRFCVGDKFYLCNNKIVCHYDFDESLLASLARQPRPLCQPRSWAATEDGADLAFNQTNFGDNVQQQQQQQQQRECLMQTQSEDCSLVELQSFESLDKLESLNFEETLPVNKLSDEIEKKASQASRDENNNTDANTKAPISNDTKQPQSFSLKPATKIEDLQIHNKDGHKHENSTELE